MEKKLYTLIVHSENIAGLLNQITAVFTRRQLNIESLNASASSIKGIHRYTITTWSDEDTIIKVEGGIMAAGSVSAILDKDPDPENLLRTVMSDFDIRILESSEVAYKCYCSRERVERALISLGVEELEGILQDQGSCQLTCQFCDAVYDFSGEELQALIDVLKK